jgi:cell division protein FtsN
VPVPSIDRQQTDAPSATTPSAAPGGVGVQVGAYSTRAQAEAGWSQLSGRYDALQGRNHRVLQGTADSGTIYRLQAVAGSAAEADTLCRTIKAAGGDCQVKR